MGWRNGWDGAHTHTHPHPSTHPSTPTHPHPFAHPTHPYPPRARALAPACPRTAPPPAARAPRAHPRTHARPPARARAPLGMAWGRMAPTRAMQGMQAMRDDAGNAAGLLHICSLLPSTRAPVAARVVMMHQRRWECRRCEGQRPSLGRQSLGLQSATTYKILCDHKD